LLTVEFIESEFDFGHGSWGFGVETRETRISRIHTNCGGSSEFKVRSSKFGVQSSEFRSCAFHLRHPCQSVQSVSLPPVRRLLPRLAGHRQPFR
jgi:hypothetical protein